MDSCRILLYLESLIACVLSSNWFPSGGLKKEENENTIFYVGYELKKIEKTMSLTDLSCDD